MSYPHYCLFAYQCQILRWFLIIKNLIVKENRGRSRVYLFYNKLNSNPYIESGVDFTDRLGDYFLILI